MARGPHIRKAFKTAAFVIHNPSGRKQAMLRDCLKRNHLAYTKALKLALDNLERYAEFKPGKKRDYAVARDVQPVVGPMPISIGAKAGLRVDIAGQASSHIELRQKLDTVSHPTAALLTGAADVRADALDRLKGVTTTEDLMDVQADLSRAYRAGQCRPVLFVKNSKEEGFLVFREPESNRYFIYLNLHPKESRFAKTVKIDGLMNVRTGERMTFTSKTGALFPVNFGRDFQDREFLAKARPQSAKLLEKDGRFEVHVTFEYDVPRLTPRTWLGVDRGIYNLASMAVVDDAGTMLTERNMDGRQLRFVQKRHERLQRKMQQRGKIYKASTRRALADEAVHVVANAIVDMALEHCSQVVMENLENMTSRKGKRKRSNFNRILNRSQYAKLQQLLAYKLAVVGLPPLKTVSAAYTSMTCPVCGHADKENRKKTPAGDGFDVGTFACMACGHTHDADLNAARIIATRKIWRENLPPSQKTKYAVDLPVEHQFATWIKEKNK